MENKLTRDRFERGVSAVVPTFNSAKYLRQSLNSLGWVDELIVVDGGSADDSMLVAREFTSPLEAIGKSYSQRMNIGLSEAHHEWILQHNGNEAVSQALALEVRRVTQRTGGCNGYFVPRLTYLWGYWSPELPGPLYLYRNSGAVFRDNAQHERFPIEGPVGRLSAYKIHIVAESVEQLISKWNSFTSLDAASIVSGGGGSLLWRRPLRRITTPELLLRMIAAFTDSYVRGRGFKDGPQGFIRSSLVGFYSLMESAKVWQLSKGGGSPFDNLPLPLATGSTAPEQGGREQPTRGRIRRRGGSP